MQPPEENRRTCWGYSAHDGNATPLYATARRSVKGKRRFLSGLARTRHREITERRERRDRELDRPNRARQRSSAPVGSWCRGDVTCWRAPLSSEEIVRQPPCSGSCSAPTPHRTATRSLRDRFPMRSSAGKNKSRNCHNVLRWTTGDRRWQVGRLWFWERNGLTAPSHPSLSAAAARTPNPCKSRAATWTSGRTNPPRYRCHPHRSWARSSGKSDRCWIVLVRGAIGR